jgi:hypothetical protein
MRRTLCLWPLLACLVAGLHPRAAAAEDAPPPRSVAEILTLVKTQAEPLPVAAAVAEAARHGDAAVAPLVRFWRDERPTADQAEVIGGVFAALGTERALRGARVVMGWSYLASDEVADLPALVRYLAAAGEGEDATGTLAYLWGRLPVDGQAYLRELAGREEAELALPEQYRVLLALNHLIALDDLYDAQAFRGVTIPPAAAALLRRHKPGAERLDAGISPVEVFRLNRLLLGAALTGFLAEPVPLDTDAYHQLTAVAAFEGLPRFELPAARSMVLGHRPDLIVLQGAHIRALARLDAAGRLPVLLDYLLARSRGPSSAALRTLQGGRPDFAGAGAARQLAGLVRRVLRDPEAYNDHVWLNLLQATVYLAPTDEAGEILAAALEDAEGPRRRRAFKTVLQYHKFLGHADVQDALYDWVAERAPRGAEPTGEELTREELQALLEAMRRSRAPGALPVAALCLESRYAPVREGACEVMERLTEQKHGFGRNPVRWLEWYRRQR